MKKKPESAAVIAPNPVRELLEDVIEDCIAIFTDGSIHPQHGMPTRTCYIPALDTNMAEQFNTETLPPTAHVCVSPERPSRCC